MAEEKLDLAIVTQTVDQSTEILVLYDGSSSRSNASKEKLVPILEDLESTQIAKMERSLDLPEGDLLPFEVTQVNTASEGQNGDDSLHGHPTLSTHVHGHVRDLSNR